jgi:uncharacterized protein YodC (DUF2158 family)
MNISIEKGQIVRLNSEGIEMEVLGRLPIKDGSVICQWWNGSRLEKYPFPDVCLTYIGPHWVSDIETEN